MTRALYPAVFYKDDNFLSVYFPDIPGCYTCGKTIDEAIEMAEDALNLMVCTLEDNGKEVPPPSDPRSIKPEETDNFITLVKCDTIQYRKLYDSKAVKKTLTIPGWLNTLAERAGLNFSALLQNAIKAELHITE